MNEVIAKAADKFTETDIDDETVVMNIESGDFFSLTGTARAIWTLIDGKSGLATITANLASQYGTEPGEIAADVEAFIAQLEAGGLIMRG